MNDAGDTADAVTTIDSEELAAHVERNDVFLLDLRKSAHGGQIYGAIRYDPKKLRGASKLILPLPKSDGLVVLYDEQGDSNALRDLAEKLRSNGYGTLRILEGGYAAWERAGGRTEEPTIEQPVPLASEHQINR